MPTKQYALISDMRLITRKYGILTFYHNVCMYLHATVDLEIFVIKILDGSY